ncbi:RNA ligase family protein [Streptomyces avicenniae]|uniref:RNA ligase family protein n=1 Tax=Streptomyces avicenniae TaxID=500153 RepID=UPI000B088296|nr:RNA ligase family protein [Streptomyces avicenniae]
MSSSTAGPAPQPYPKIPTRQRPDAPGGREWIALEKVHGAHLAVLCDAAGARPAKRRELLDDDALDGFFGVSRLWPALAVAVSRLASAVRATWGDDAVVTVYGELAGGHYPHQDVPAAPGVQPVQTGVWYAPDLRWLPFDATVERAGGRWWLSDAALREAAAGAGLTCVPALGRGTAHALQDLPVAFPTRVPALLGLPQVADNLAEGLVLKPAGAWRESGQDGEAGEGPRPVVKRKRKEFAEDARYDGARPWSVPPEGAAGVPAWLLVEATALLTPARAAGAVSKLGSRTPVDAVAAEIAEDAAAELADALGGLDAAVLGAVRRALGPGARALALLDAEDRGGRLRAPS